MINSVTLVGRLTKDPDLRETGSGNKVANFTLALQRKFKNQDGEYEADFINCQVWRQQAENLEKYVRKGDLVGVNGRIQTRTYDDQDGNRKYITEIVCDSVTYLETNREKESYKTEEKKPQDFQEPTEDDLPF